MNRDAVGRVAIIQNRKHATRILAHCFNGGNQLIEMLIYCLCLFIVLYVAAPAAGVEINCTKPMHCAINSSPEAQCRRLYKEGLVCLRVVAGINIGFSTQHPSYPLHYALHILMSSRGLAMFQLSC